MNTLKQKSNKNKIIVVSIIAFLLLGLIGIYSSNIFGWRSPSRASSTIDYGDATDSQKKAGSNTKSNTTSSDTKPGTSDSEQPSTPIQQEGSKDIVTVSISASSQNNPTYQIRSLIGYITDEGTCTLTLTGPQSQIVTKTSGVQALPSSSTCEGFDIPVSELSSGTWSVKLVFENPKVTGNVTKNITVN